MPEWIATISIGQIVTASATFGGFAWLIRKLSPFAHVLDDILGSPPRPGVPSRPGVLERMFLIERAQAGLTAQVTELATEIRASNHREDRK